MSSLQDHSNSYGWLSIGLHWLSAIVILGLWAIGNSIDSLPLEQMQARKELHISLAVCFWLLMLARIVWRLRSIHPKIDGVGRKTHLVAKLAHYALLLVLAVLIISGPIMVWAQAQPVTIFGAIPFPVSAQYSALADIALAVHAFCAGTLFFLVILHIAGFMKHLMFHDDETTVRMFWPKKNSKQSLG